MSRRSDIDAKLQAIYDQIPEVLNCKGHCWMSCGPVPMSDREQQRLRERGDAAAAQEVIRGQLQETAAQNPDYFEPGVGTHPDTEEGQR